MKSKILLLVLIVCAQELLFSCASSKDDDPAPPAPTVYTSNYKSSFKTITSIDSLYASPEADSLQSYLGNTLYRIIASYDWTWTREYTTEAEKVHNDSGAVYSGNRAISEFKSFLEKFETHKNDYDLGGGKFEKSYIFSVIRDGDTILRSDLLTVKHEAQSRYDYSTKSFTIDKEDASTHSGVVSFPLTEAIQHFGAIKIYYPKISVYMPDGMLYNPTTEENFIVNYNLNEAQTGLVVSYLATAYQHDYLKAHQGTWHFLVEGVIGYHVKAQIKVPFDVVFSK